MRVIIDTNCLLDFFRKHEHENKIINNFIKYHKEKKYTISIPKQIKDEYYRNLPNVIKEHTDNLPEARVSKLPEIIGSSQIGKQFLAIQKKYAQKRKKLIETYVSKANNKKSNINILIEKLLTIGESPVETNELIVRAKLRVEKGNPPLPNSKNSGIGDAIIWQTAIENFCDDDLAIISRDGDYESKIDPKVVHHFLKREWASISSGKKVILYKTIPEFLKEVIENKKEKKRMENIIKSEEKYSVNTVLDANQINLYGHLLPHKTECLHCGVIYEYNPWNASVSVMSMGVNSDELCEKCSSYFLQRKICDMCKRPYYSSSLSSTSSETYYWNSTIYGFKNLCKKCSK